MSFIIYVRNGETFAWKMAILCPRGQRRVSFGAVQVVLLYCVADRKLRLLLYDTRAPKLTRNTADRTFPNGCNGINGNKPLTLIQKIHFQKLFIGD